jgi:hypothetical protein
MSRREPKRPIASLTIEDRQVRQREDRINKFEEEWDGLPQIPVDAGIAFQWGEVKIQINNLWDRLWRSLYETIYSRETLAATEFKAEATASPEYLGQLVTLQDELREFKTTNKFKDALACMTMFSGLETLCANRLYDILHSKGLDNSVALVLSDTAGREGNERKEITVLVLFIFACYKIRTTSPSELFEQVLDLIPDAHPGEMEYTRVLSRELRDKSNALLNWAILVSMRGDKFPKENTALAWIVSKLVLESDPVKFMADIEDLAQPNMTVEELKQNIRTTLSLGKYGQTPETVASVVPEGTMVIPLSAIDIKNGIGVAGESIIQKPQLLVKAISEMQRDIASVKKRVDDYATKNGVIHWVRLGAEEAGRGSLLYEGEILPDFRNLKEGDSQSSIDSTASMTEAQEVKGPEPKFDPVDLTNTTFGKQRYVETDPYVLSKRGVGLGSSTETEGALINKKILNLTTKFMNKKVQVTVTNNNKSNSNSSNSIPKITRITGTAVFVGRIEGKGGVYVGICLDEEYRSSYGIHNCDGKCQVANSGIYINSNQVQLQEIELGDLITFDVGGRRRRKTRKIKRTRNTKKVKKAKKSKKSRRSKK